MAKDIEEVLREKAVRIEHTSTCITLIVPISSLTADEFEESIMREVRKKQNETSNLRSGK